MLTIALDAFDNRVHVDDTTSKMDYFCPACGAQVFARKGPERRHHFYHTSDRICSDSWTKTYEDSDWHFGWQNRFPKENQEVTLVLDGTKHRADVITGYNVIEFQRSALTTEQFSARNAFYTDLGYKVIWLFDLRDLYESGEIMCSGTEGNLSFLWENPRKAFRQHDLTFASVDIFFQLRDESVSSCIVMPNASSSDGFESFSARRWLSPDGFLEYVGLRDGICAPTEIQPLEPNEDYLRFKEQYGIDLNAQQERAAQVVGGATLLLAVPGSGKTTTLVARLGYLALERGVPPESIAAITYTTKAAEDMRRRFASRFRNEDAAGRIRFCTINSLALSIYADSCAKKGVGTFELIDGGSKAKLLRDVYLRATGEYATEADCIDLETYISYAKNMMMSEGDVASWKVRMQGFPEMYRSYQTYLESNRLIDYDDQLRFAFDALSEDRELREEYRQRYRYWCVDEAQDTSKLQHNLIYRLVGRTGNVFMVGDEDQSIYGFRAAYPKALLNFKYVYRNPFVLMMEINYRSGSEIIDAANGFIGRNKGRFNKRMTSERGPGSIVRAVDVPSRCDQWRAAHELIRGHSGQLAVLYRDNDAAIPLVDRLLREGIPFSLLKGKKAFFDSHVVTDVRAFFSLSLDPRDTEAFKRIYYRASCYIRRNDAEWACKKARRNGPDILDALVAQMDGYRPKRRKATDTRNAKRFRRLIQDLSNKTPVEAIDSLIRGGYGDYLDENSISTSRIDILRAIAEQEETIQGFLSRLDYLSETFGGQITHKEATSLTLSSTHSAKGLEFDSVLIFDAVDGIFPSSTRNPFATSKDNADDYQEERRLFYVAMTRARNELILMRVLDEATSFIDEVIPRKSKSREIASADMSGTAAQNHVPVKPTSPRYDIWAWELVEHRPPNGRIVTNGSMDAMITTTPTDTIVEMVIDYESTVLRDASAHVQELAYGASEFFLCLSAIGCQRANGLEAIGVGDGAVVLHMLDEDAIRCLEIASGLAERGIPLTATYLDESGRAVGRPIGRVDVGSQRIVLQNQVLDTY